MLKAAPKARQVCCTVRSAASQGTVIVRVSSSHSFALSCVRTAKVLLVTLKVSGPAYRQMAFLMGTCIFLVALHILHCNPPTARQSKAEVCHPFGI